MADFKIAFDKTIRGNEGGYNPGTGEAETYMGIDRHANPHWKGWFIIDALKWQNPHVKTAMMNVLLAQNFGLQEEIFKFYKSNYWDTVNLDYVRDQQLADNLFDCSVNQGEGMARRIMQHACNAVIDRYKDCIKYLVLDGKIGITTLATINALPPVEVMDEINAEREASYRRCSNFPEWGKVWLRRLVKYLK